VPILKEQLETLQQELEELQRYPEYHPPNQMVVDLAREIRAEMGLR
jgi:hypothetical protein